ncbi:hypothetical protein AYL99_01733 [Fonsecaea erecta]|uniref:Uncharacterized protein n=1 Tax=Fonsecaea erecta TaxID=1367422 RepID=A0A179A2B5_9EURO|nr:hypothetical protein AYL99_01733 [Fonsecaea erecta]OAP65761.1 hypothetical protein AYL99_01733 [Fonsecaea erecta]
MASSASDTPEQDPAQRQRLFDDHRGFLHTSTLAACFLAPALVALPPRKLDLYTFSLTGAFIGAANYQLRERTGLGFMGHASRRFVNGQVPRFGQEIAGPANGDQRLPFEHAVVPGMVQQNETSALQDKAREAWTTGRNEDWKQRRLKEEQEKLEQGESYWSMIVDQVWEVWNQGEEKVDELKERDEEAVQKQKDQG